MISCLVIVGGIGLLYGGGDIVEVKDSLEEIHPQKVINPSTRESWDSIEDYVYRNLNKSGKLMNGNS